MNAGILYFVFSEPVIILDTSGFTVFSDAIFMQTFVNLSHYCTGDGSRTPNINVKLALQDYIDIQTKNPMGTSIATTFVSVATRTLTDMVGNKAGGVQSQLPVLAAASILIESEPPVILAMHYNKSTSRLSTYFDHALLPSATKPAAFALVSETGSKQYLGQGQVDMAHSKANLAEIDTSQCVGLVAVGIGLSQRSAVLYLPTKGAVEDLAGTQSVAMSLLGAVPDGQMIISFRLDMTLGTITLEFVYPITVRKLQPQYISLVATAVATARAPQITYTLTSYKSFAIPNPYFLVIKMAKVDYNGLQSAIPLTSKRSIETAIVKAAVIDAFDYVLAKNMALSCDDLVKDTVPPQLLSVNLNMGTGLLTLFFAEPVTFSLMKLKNFHLTSSRGNESEVVTLRNSTIITPGESVSIVKTLYQP